MKNLSIKLFFTLLAGLCLHHSMQAQRPRMVVDGNHGMTVLEHLISDEPDHPEHDNRNYLRIKVKESSDKSFIMEESGLLVLGTEDLCIRHESTNNMYLSINGNAMKTEGGALWTVASDENLRRNMTPLEKSADKFRTVNFYSYEDKKSGKINYGISEREVKKDFPNSVGTLWIDGTKYDTFNPSNLFYTGMKVIQENSQKALEQEAHIHTLEAQLATEKTRNDQLAAEVEAIKTALANANIDIPTPLASELEPISATSDDLSLKSTTSRLKQNIPNPFQQSTSIPYYLPSNTQQATLVIHDMTGKTMLKQTLPNQEGEGKIEIDLSNSQLRGGIYTYSLYVNKQLIDTKKLSLLTK